MLVLPEEFTDKMKNLLKEEYQDYLDSFDEKYGQTLRVNRLKAEPADLIRRFLLATEEKEVFEPVPWCPEGYYYKGDRQLSLHPWYHAGLYYLQEPSAMGPAAFLPVKPGSRVLDLCAAPGGKSTALAAKLQGQGWLLSNDVSASRCKSLVRNLELAGAANVLVTCETPDRLADYFPEYFDAILVDAPCSGEGMFRRDPHMTAHWSPGEVARYSNLQEEILEQAWRMLAPGGRLLYSTCTYSPEEDEAVVWKLVSKHPDLRLLPIDGPDASAEGVDQPVPSGNWPSAGRPDWVGEEEPVISLDAEGDQDVREQKQSLRYCRRFWNHKLKGEGQFAALLSKDGRKESQDASVHSRSWEKKAGRSDYFNSISRRKSKSRRGEDGRNDDAEAGREAMESFLADCDLTRLLRQSGDYLMIGSQVYLPPAGMPPTAGLRIIRSGLLLGEIKKKRFEPSQALALALRRDEYARIWNLTAQSEDLVRYLKGESLSCPAGEGYVLVCVDGWPLGWGKCVKGRLKNKYKTSWRLR